jgi:hypothetical protein
MHRVLEMQIYQFRNLLDKVTTLESELLEKDYENGTHIMDSKEYEKLSVPPKNAGLLLSDVRLLFKKDLKSLYVIEPQGYNDVVKLDKTHYMMRPLPDESCGKYECGLFHSGKSGIAQSGGGGDAGDKWYLANNAMYRHLKKKLNFMANIKKNHPQE